MKVIHINSSDRIGGAAIAAARHCEAMRMAGIDAKMLVLYKTSETKDFIYSIYSNNIWNKLRIFFYTALSNTIIKLFKYCGTFSFPIFSVSISKNPLVLDADIIYLHWVGASMLSTSEIERILKLGKPVRWYMHDMNPITGGCHHSLGCSLYQSECQKCPLQKRNIMGISLSSIQYKKRMRMWSKYSNLEAYTPSKWLKSCVEKSTIWKGHKVTEFPNVINQRRFHPIEKRICRDILGIDKKKKIVLFGAANIGDYYKGWRYMKDAINELDPQKYEAIIFGDYNTTIAKELNIRCNFTGYLNDEYSLIVAYNAADVLVSSSLADNYPNVIIEAMACGLPCVGFNIGGIPNQIEHKKNGYLAEERNAYDLANGIKFVCEADERNYNTMQNNAREFVEKIASYDKYRDINNILRTDL